MGLSLEPRQSQMLSPKIIQSIKILQMSSQKLSEYLEEAAEQNPLLDIEENFISDYVQVAGQTVTGTVRRNGAETPDISIYSKTCESLKEHLKFQLHSLQVKKDLLPISDYIIECLNERGYLEDSLEQINADLNVSLEEVKNSLSIVQSLEPAGIAARDLSECLLLQLKLSEENIEIEELIIKEYLHLLSKGQYKSISQKLDVPLKRVIRACERIRKLNPIPGTGFSGNEQTKYIVPDVVLEKKHGRIYIIWNNRLLPKISINNYYKNIIKTTDNIEIKKYVSERTQQASWLINNIEMRKNTVTSCVMIILDIQRDFFMKPDGRILPMVLSDLAERMGKHVSTISRAISNKYIQCDKGVFPLSHFFSQRLSKNGENSCSPDYIKNEIKDLIYNEDRKKPLSDKRLADIFAARGISISRRTVAKYRDDMMIGSTVSRKIY